MKQRELTLWNPQKERSRNWYRRKRFLDPRYQFLHSSRSRASDKGIENTLSLEDIVIPSHCPVFGTKLKVGGKDKDSASIDRTDPSKGYIPGNVQIMSFRANRLKNDATLEELELLVKYMKNCKGKL